MAAVFSERLVVHLVVYGRAPSLRAALMKTSVVFCLLVTWSLCLAAMVVDRRQVTQIVGSLRALLHQVLADVLSPQLLVLMVGSGFFIALATGSVGGEALPVTISHWLSWASAEVLEARDDLLQPETLSLGGGVALLYAIAWLIFHYLKNLDKPVEEALYEFIVSGYLVTAACGFYVWLSAVSVVEGVPSTAWHESLAGLVKDTLIYALVAYPVLAGTFKAEDTLRGLGGSQARWTLFAVAAGIVTACVVAAMFADLRFKDEILMMGRSVEYPHPAQQQLIGAHIMFRAFGLLAPLILVAFVRFAREIERVNKGRSPADFPAPASLTRCPESDRRR